MHIHHPVVDRGTGRNVFSNPDGSEAEVFHHFIGGLQKHMPAATALMAPYVNSYRRYVPDLAAPINLAWGRDNRTTGLRVPISGPEARRIENRLPGMDCNPYLAIAASLTCGLLGMRDKTKPSKEYEGDAYLEAPADIPRTFGEALTLFTEDTALKDVLGEEFCKIYGTVKDVEYKEFLQVISPWEREHLLTNV